jgi:alkylhydroperoxidase/carboxymuconolactone decarboxylase family protein YurZ
MTKRPPLPKTVESFSESFAPVWQAFQKLGDECHGAGPLDDRVRRLVKVGIAAAPNRKEPFIPRFAMRKQPGFPLRRFVTWSY